MKVKNYVIKKYNIKTDIIEIPDVTRADLAQMFAELDFKVGAEIGVAAGEYSQIIMRFNPQLTEMYGVDPHEPYPGYKDYTRTGTFNKLMDDAHARLDKYPQYKFIRKYSVDAAGDFPDHYFDFVYIDANHQEEFAYEDMVAWFPKVKPGGVLAGHDYARLAGNEREGSSNWGVIPALHRFAKERELEIFVWGLEAKIGNLKRDGSRSWMVIA